MTLFTQYYEGVKGNSHFLWKEDPTDISRLTQRNKVINDVTKSLPKYFSRTHKKIMRSLTENVMFDRISPAQFRQIYKEITGDDHYSGNKGTTRV